jgi:phospholipid/cholesterol/gamma-HCH transport system ATP-binding protein
MSALVLEIAGAAPHPSAESPLRGPADLRLPAGELALVRAGDQAMARALVALAAGLTALAAGRVRLLGQDLAALPRRAAEALRARIGLAPGEGGWLPHLPIAESLLLARRHHGDADPATLDSDANALCQHFGLPGIPTGSPHELSRLDLARAACARAFLGRPALLLLESPLDAEAADALVAPLRARLEPTLAGGTAAIWITRSPRAWDDPGFPARQRLLLSASGLVPA